MKIVDIDECDAKDVRCDPNANCINKPGSFKCICKEGFKGDGVNCVSDAPTGKQKLLDHINFLFSLPFNGTD